MENYTTDKMELEFRFSVNDEIKRIKEHYEVFDWLKENQYTEPIMPGNIKFYSSKEEDALTELEKEFDENKYIEFKEELFEGFNKKKELFKEYLEKIFDEEVPKKISVILSCYGLGGNYFPPDTIEINIKRHSAKKTVSLLFHEIIHLIFEKYVEKYGLTHWEKERTVDLILHHNKELNMDYWQPRYHGTEKYVDEIFKKTFFSDREQFFKEVVNKREIKN